MRVALTKHTAFKVGSGRSSKGMNAPYVGISAAQEDSRRRQVTFPFTKTTLKATEVFLRHSNFVVCS